VIKRCAILHALVRPLVLITGTSSGIGLASAVACANAGFEVVATMRNLDRRARLDAAASEHGLTSERETARGLPTIHVEQLDVTAQGVGGKVRELLLKYGPIELLVNNAGIAVGGVFEEQSDRDVRDQFETNIFGAMAVTRALLPTMRAAGHGRVINVSSMAGRIGFPGLAAYAATKHALEGFSEALRYEVGTFGVEVCVVEPGPIRTELFDARQRSAARADPDGPYAELWKHVDDYFSKEAQTAVEPAIVGDKIAQLLADSAPPFRTVVGGPARAMSALRRVIPDALFSSGMRRLMGL
jgi:NAD(P)-dependent dehydrogenase (short-subunit alcohol dehydrogenase family)